MQGAHGVIVLTWGKPGHMLLLYPVREVSDVLSSSSY